MITAFLLPLVWAHGGEDHSVGAPAAAVAEGTRAATWSSEFEAVVDLGEARVGEPLAATLLLADFNTSAPIEAGSAALVFEGPQRVEASASAGDHPGFWPFEVQFPVAGEYSGAITVLTPSRSDALGLPPITLGAHEHEAAEAARSPWLAAALVGVVALILGFFLGRRAALLTVVLLSARLVQAHGGEDHGPPPAPTPTESGLHLSMESQFLLELRTARVGRHPLVEQVEALGTVVARPGGHATLRAPISGVLEMSRLLLPGESVKVGENLGSLVESMAGADRASLALSRGGAELAVAEARAELALAERDAARAEGLGQVLSERERLARQQALSVATERLRQAEAALSAMPSSRVPLRSPLNGQVTGLLARPGDAVSAGDELMHISAPGALWVEARVPETQAGRIGTQATVRADARPEVLLEATVLDPGLEADPVSGMLRLVLVVNEPPAWLVPGMSVTASVNVGEPREALTVSDTAVVDSQGETLVFVKTGPESFAARRLRVGARSGDEREVLAGLEPGERVVVVGTYSLRSLAGR